MDPVTIATTAVAALIPYLGEAGKKFAGKVGEAAFEKTGELYVWLKQRLGGKPAAGTALDDLAQAPDDPDNAASLRKELKKLLAEDADLLRELSGRLGPATQENIAFNNQIAGNVGSITQIGKAGDVHIGKP
jgi:hypothetical protein